MVDEAVGKEPVGKKGAISIIDKEVAAVVVHIIDRFRVIRIFVSSCTDIVVNHVMKGLENIAYDSIRSYGKHFKEIIEGECLAMLPLADFSIKMLYGNIYI
jgi:hypothetical protein